MVEDCRQSPAQNTASEQCPCVQRRTAAFAPVPLACLAEGEGLSIPLAGIVSIEEEAHFREEPEPGLPVRLVSLSESRLRRPTPFWASMPCLCCKRLYRKREATADHPCPCSSVRQLPGLLASEQTFLADSGHARDAAVLASRAWLKTG